MMPEGIALLAWWKANLPGREVGLGKHAAHLK